MIVNILNKKTDKADRTNLRLCVLNKKTSDSIIILSKIVPTKKTKKVRPIVTHLHRVFCYDAETKQTLNTRLR